MPSATKGHALAARCRPGDPASHYRFRPLPLVLKVGITEGLADVPDEVGLTLAHQAFYPSLFSADQRGSIGTNIASKRGPGQGRPHPIRRARGNVKGKPSKGGRDGAAHPWKAASAEGGVVPVGSRSGRAGLGRPICVLLTIPIPIPFQAPGSGRGRRDLAGAFD
jgi:hypothetical protein